MWGIAGMMQLKTSVLRMRKRKAHGDSITILRKVRHRRWVGGVAKEHQGAPLFTLGTTTGTIFKSGQTCPAGQTNRVDVPSGRLIFCNKAGPLWTIHK